MKNLQTVRRTAKAFQILSIVAMVAASLLFRYGTELESKGTGKLDTN